MKNRLLTNRLNELRTLKILDSMEEDMILNVLFTHRQIYAGVVKELNSYVDLMNKGFLIEQDGEVVMNKQLHHLLAMKTETVCQNTEYNDILVTLKQMVNGR